MKANSSPLNRLSLYLAANPSICITIFSASSYLFAISYYFGYFYYYGIGMQFGDIGITDVLNLLPYSLIILLCYCVLFLTLQRFSVKTWAITWYKINLIPIIFCIAISILYDYKNLVPFIVAGIALQVILLLIHRRIVTKNWDRLYNHELHEQIREIESSKPTHTLFPYILLVVLVLSIFIGCFGFRKASRKEYYWQFSNNPKIVILKHREGYFICKDFNPLNMTVGNSLVLIRRENPDTTTLLLKKIGKLKRGNYPDRMSFY